MHLEDKAQRMEVISKVRTDIKQRQISIIMHCGMNEWLLIEVTDYI